MQNEALPYTAIFAHGLGGNADQGKYYNNFIGCSITGQDGPEWDKSRYQDGNMGPQQSYLAQEADVVVIVRQIMEQVQKNIILLGVSKGAATMIDTVGLLALHHPEALNNVKAVILDSPFACPERVAAGIARRLPTQLLGSTIGDCVETCTNGPIIRSIIQRLFVPLSYPNYNPDGITPIKAVTDLWSKPTVNRDMVLVFIHSQQDKLIPIDNSRELYVELKKLGFKNLYLIEAPRGGHGNVCWGPDGEDIFKKLCLIYKKHNLPLPHSAAPTIESNIEQLLAEIQPSIEEVNKRMHPWLDCLGLA